MPSVCLCDDRGHRSSNSPTRASVPIVDPWDGCWQDEGLGPPGAPPVTFYCRTRLVWAVVDEFAACGERCVLRMSCGPCWINAFLLLGHAVVIRTLGERFSSELRKMYLSFKRVTWGERKRKKSKLILQFKYI